MLSSDCEVVVLQCMTIITICTHGLHKGRILQICYFDCITQQFATKEHTILNMAQIF